MIELDNFFTLTTDVMCVVDTHGRAQSINPAFEKVLGYGLSDLLKVPSLWAYVHPDDWDASAQAIASLTAECPTVHFRHRYQCKNQHENQCENSSNDAAEVLTDEKGHWRWLAWTISRVNESTSGTLLYCIAHDITEQLQDAGKQLAAERDCYQSLLKTERATHDRAEKASAQAQLYAEAVQNMSVGLYIWQLEDVEDDYSLRMVATNPAATEFTGITMESVLGKTILEAFPALADTDIPAVYANVARTKQPEDLGDVPYEDGRIKGIFSVKAFPLAANCTGISFENVTASWQADIELKKQKDDLIAVNMMLTHTTATLEQRNQELDQFAYVTSHDLKAPLRAISSLAGWIEEDLGEQLPPENVEQFELLKSRVHRMEALINGLLEYSRVGRVQRHNEYINLNELLGEIIDSLSPLGEFSIEITTPMPSFEASKTPLIQVFSNLISNAIKHHDKSSGRVQISAREQGDFYEFSVSDDGPGIAPAYQEKIFTIFQTLQSRDDLESTGIGLSIVRKSVRAVGGQISLHSEIGEGASFRFTWPKSPIKPVNNLKSIEK